MPSGRLKQVKIYFTAEQYEKLRRVAEQRGVKPLKIVSARTDSNG